VALKHGTLLNPLCTAVNRAFFFPDTVQSLGNGAEVPPPPLPPPPPAVLLWG